MLIHITADVHTFQRKKQVRILPLVYSLQYAFYPWSAFYPRSVVCSLRFTPTDPYASTEVLASRFLNQRLDKCTQEQYGEYEY